MAEDIYYYADRQSTQYSYTVNDSAASGRYVLDCVVVLLRLAHISVITGTAYFVYVFHKCFDCISSRLKLVSYALEYCCYLTF